MGLGSGRRRPIRSDPFVVGAAGLSFQASWRAHRHHQLFYLFRPVWSCAWISGGYRWTAAAASPRMARRRGLPQPAAATATVYDRWWVAPYAAVAAGDARDGGRASGERDDRTDVASSQRYGGPARAQAFTFSSPTGSLTCSPPQNCSSSLAGPSIPDGVAAAAAAATGAAGAVGTTSAAATAAIDRCAGVLRRWQALRFHAASIPRRACFGCFSRTTDGRMVISGRDLHDLNVFGARAKL